MRKFRWPIAIVLILSLLAAAFIFKKPSDDIPTLRRYVVDDKRSYVPTEVFPTKGADSPYAIEIRVVRLKGIKKDDLLSFVKGYAGSRGWRVRASSTSSSFFYAVAGVDDWDAISITMWDREEPFSGTDDLLLRIMRPKSKWDILLWRLKHPGRNPFSQSPSDG